MSDVEDPARRSARIPVLRSEDLDPRHYARSTCFTAGYLVSKNAGWRNVRPVVDRVACTGCLQCYLYCPDGTIYKTSGTAGGPLSDADEDSGFNTDKSGVAIDYDFCKGCGICAKVCSFDAITMIPEKGDLST